MLLFEYYEINDVIMQQFKIEDRVVHPIHGVCEITDIKKEVIYNQEVEIYVLKAQKPLTLKIPVNRINSIRAIANDSQISQVYEILSQPPQHGNRKIVWAKKHQEYVNKINSGDPIKIAEIVRDLYKNSSENNNSYSERSLYFDALKKLVKEVAISKDKEYDQISREFQNILNSRIEKFEE